MNPPFPSSWACQEISSPVGPLRLYASMQGLTAVLLPRERAGRVPLPKVQNEPDNPILNATAQQLAEYFAGARRTFDLPLDAQGTAFQKQVWAALQTIPFGETRSYLDIARQIGNTAAIRAVGSANGRNPIAIIVPCHRVIGSDGSLTGFAGGLEMKEALLRHEGFSGNQLAFSL